MAINPERYDIVAPEHNVEFTKWYRPGMIVEYDDHKATLLSGRIFSDIFDSYVRVGDVDGVSGSTGLWDANLIELTWNTIN